MLFFKLRGLKHNTGGWKMNLSRCRRNPLISPAEVKPFGDNFEVAGVFNPAVSRLGDEIILLLRVAQAPVSKSSEIVLTAFYDETSGRFLLKEFSKKDRGIDFSDPRLIVTLTDTYLTSISHLRLARSRDGIDFRIEAEPAMSSANFYESFGIEDPRISLIGDTYYITYVAVSPAGVTTCLASTKDFRSFERHGVIFCPENKDVVIFPERIGGKYYALHRPVTPLFKRHDMWIAESEDLLGWGNHRRLLSTRAGDFDSVKTGGGAVPFRTKGGWLEVYHGADENNRYCLGAVLLDAARPWEVLARTDEPILAPEADYETGGFFGNAVFSCGLLYEDGIVKLYYGAADTSIACAEMDIEYIVSKLRFY